MESDTDSSSDPSELCREACFSEALTDLIYLLFQRGTLDVKDLSRLACVATPLRKFIGSFLEYDAVLCYRVDLLREHLKALEKRRERIEALFQLDYTLQERREILKKFLDDMSSLTDDVKRNARDYIRIVRKGMKQIINCAEKAAVRLAPAELKMLRDTLTPMLAFWIETKLEMRRDYEPVVSRFTEHLSNIERLLAELEDWCDDT